ncbi:MAG TPA: hypothetical protein VHD87_02760 [Acidimicrobiales bacterium]|nr:hypothetical protein [Acidimicrobiales bacterium]
MAWYLADYKPLPTLVARHIWELIAAVVLRAVAEATPLSPLEAKYMASPAAQYVAWCYELGVNLEDPQAVWAKSQIERWIAGTKDRLSLGSRSNYRAALEHIAAANNPDWSDFAAAPLNRTSAAAPYTPAQLVQLEAWARWQPAGVRRDNALLLMYLALGAGLLTKDLRVVRGCHVATDDIGTQIHLPGPRPRTVPVLHQYAATIVAAAAERGDRPMILPHYKFRGPNLVTGFVAGCVASEAPRLSVVRLRTNWLVWHFEHGTPWRPLAAAAGTSTDALGRYTRFTTMPGDDVARRRLHGDPE